MGGTTRQGGSNQPQRKAISEEEKKLAERMGVKGDPAKAKERFLKRQESGQSNLGAIGGYPSVIRDMENL